MSDYDNQVGLWKRQPKKNEQGNCVYQDRWYKCYQNGLNSQFRIIKQIIEQILEENLEGKAKDIFNLYIREEDSSPSAGSRTSGRAPSLFDNASRRRRSPCARP